MQDKAGAVIRQFWSRYKYILMVILAGVVLLLLPTGDQNKNSDPAEALSRQEVFDTQKTEDRLERILSRIQHAGQVRVMLSIKESAHSVLAYDTKTTADNSQYDTVIVSQGTGNQKPVVLHELAPKYQGALIVCEGGDDPTVKLQIMEAVRALTGLSADRISVCKGK
ncbi:MAG: stage III sporulation protein AG [Oscillospiraceae bacterium]|nr:stage III sporulation protein AG [Oscillospiraceae bacterium]